ncbi:MAG: FAD binding domain-containing protein [Vicinamibacterales bacterium]
MPRYDLRVPANLSETLALLAEPGPAWRPFAGGTDLMVLLEAGKLPHTRYVSLWGLAALTGTLVSDDEVVLGALTTYAEIRGHHLLAAEFPLLVAAARETGGIATQNRGTIGGNIANASPAADTPPALLVYDASLDLVSARGRRQVPYAGFHTGYKTMDLGADELIAAVRLPRLRRWTHQDYRKVGTRRAQAIAKVCFAGALAIDDGVVTDARLAFGSVAPTSLRAIHAEAAIRGQRLDATTIAAADAALAGDIAPIDDVRSTARYRSTVAVNVMKSFLTGAGATGS